MEHEGEDKRMKGCITQCLDCYRVCWKTIMHCLRAGGEHAKAEHIRLLIDCAEICQLSANFMLRESQFHKKLCVLCADICKQCADECAKFEDDAEMQNCADVCRLTEQSCRKMANS